MATEKTVLIQGTEDLARGERDNVTLSDGAVVLEQAAGKYVNKGCYTAPISPLPQSEELLVSWNADTPAGTWVEVEARVQYQGRWSGWLSFGKWSPFCRRQGTWQEAGADPYVQGGRLVVPTKDADALQLRAFLCTETEEETPALRLLAASARPRIWMDGKGRPLNREIRLPAYSQLCRAPAFAGCLSGPVTVAAMMNRFGQDILPEEVALACQDEAPGAKETNPAFCAAAAGSYGYSAWLCWLDLAGLRDEIRQGNPVMVRVQYAGRPEEEAPGLPWMEGVTGSARDHWLAVRGFHRDESKKEEFVLVCDPLSGTDYGAERQYRLDGFLRAFGGLCLVMRERPRDSGRHAPQRTSCYLKAAAQPNSYFFYREGQPILLEPEEWNITRPDPEDVNSQNTLSPVRPIKGVLACTLAEGKAYATTAHKHFRFDVTVTEEGAVKLPETVCQKGQRVTVYAIDRFGQMKVAERTL